MQLSDRGMPPVNLDRYTLYVYTEDGQRRTDIVCRDCREDTSQNAFYATVWGGDSMILRFALTSVMRHEYTRHPAEEKKVPTDAEVMASIPKAV